MYEDRDRLTEAIIGCAFKVSNTLGSGFLEKVYENSLSIELKTAGLKCDLQKPIPVRYQGEIVGDYYADMLVEDEFIIEIKAAKTIDDNHPAQLLHYFKVTGIHRGLILNFGTQKLGIKRMVL